MSKILFTADIHGNSKHYFALAQVLKKDLDIDLAVIVGDLSPPKIMHTVESSFYFLKHQINQLSLHSPCPILMIPGNTDFSVSFNALQKQFPVPKEVIVPSDNQIFQFATNSSNNICFREIIGHHDTITTQQHSNAVYGTIHSHTNGINSTDGKVEKITSFLSAHSYPHSVFLMEQGIVRGPSGLRFVLYPYVPVSRKIFKDYESWNDSLLGISHDLAARGNEPAIRNGLFSVSQGDGMGLSEGELGGDVCIETDMLSLHTTAHRDIKHSHDPIGSVAWLTHCPPHGILDKCHNSAHNGSVGMRRLLEELKGHSNDSKKKLIHEFDKEYEPLHPPSFTVHGHIHESGDMLGKDQGVSDGIWEYEDAGCVSLSIGNDGRAENTRSSFNYWLCTFVDGIMVNRERKKHKIFQYSRGFR
ncbi:hypothetical protein ADUPG1_007423 [Aduncisulcus paluster]|uniref:Calcineurin-like phosphoesterase domain-containing protein n=1 Tax=Aduncisulcus paluster TaxID=2918883 RepID=A0ABQ5KPT4_9EUKA|nr:hypothetical protein ADUPG1_007423 [Aduncisulcus paluster]